jgi:predicted DsbA family dithiol-disulfide isomerase
MDNMKKMKVDIWSDVRCPFCYIGKHKFEKALEQFSNRDQLEVVWRSFELDRGLETDPGVNTIDHLAASKGVSRSEAIQMTGFVTRAAQEVGLVLDLAKAVVANSFNAHKLIQFAKASNLGGGAEELLFKAHFEEGRNIDSKEVLLEIGASLGLKEKDLKGALSSDDYAYKVRQDEAQAQAYGIHGVPYFVFNERYAVSGAQSPATFLGALQQSWGEFEKENKLTVLNDGPSCSEGGCD